MAATHEASLSTRVSALTYPALPISPAFFLVHECELLGVLLLHTTFDELLLSGTAYAHHLISYARVMDYTGVLPQAQTGRC